MGRPRKQEHQITKQPSDIKKKNVIFGRRKKGIMKKAMELSTLCDIPVLVIVRSPNGDIQVWPENSSQVRGILEKYVKGNHRQNSERIEVKYTDLMMNGGLSAHQEQLLPGENICGINAGIVQNNVRPAIMVPNIINQQQYCSKVEIVGNNNANAINDHDFFFGCKQSLTHKLDDFQQPLQFHYPGMNFALDPCMGNICNVRNLDLGANLDLDLGCIWDGGIPFSGFNSDLGCNFNGLPFPRAE